MNNLFPRSRKALGLLVLGSCLAQVGNVSAAPMTVTASVGQVCQLGTLTDVDFGNLTPGGADVGATGTIQWRCSNGTSADIAIDDGGNGNRSMTGGAVTGTATLSYELYKELALTNRWGDTGAEVVNVTGNGLGAFATETVFGNVVAADYLNAEQGPYSDIVDVTITIL